jgi:hypothetical protein
MNRAMTKPISYGCWAVSLAVAVACFWRMGPIPAGAAAFVCVCAFIAARRGFASAYLALSVIVSVVGLLLGTGYAMFVYAGLSIAHWDLTTMELSSAGDPSLPGPKLYRSIRSGTLGCVIGIGLIVIFIGRDFSVKIPFALMAALVVLAAFCFDGLLKSLNRGK